MDTVTVVDHQFKVEMAKRYLRERGKYVLDPACAFKPTPSTDRFSILERYGEHGEKGACDLVRVRVSP